MFSCFGKSNAIKVQSKIESQLIEFDKLDDTGIYHDNCIGLFNFCESINPPLKFDNEILITLVSINIDDLDLYGFVFHKIIDIAVLLFTFNDGTFNLKFDTSKLFILLSDLYVLSFIC